MTDRNKAIETIRDAYESGYSRGHNDTVESRYIHPSMAADDYLGSIDSLSVEPSEDAMKVEPDAKGCDWLRENRPELWAIAAEAIRENLGKPGFTIEEEEVGA